jgi:hypothetical protein
MNPLSSIPMLSGAGSGKALMVVGILVILVMAANNKNGKVAVATQAAA